LPNPLGVAPKIVFSETGGGSDVDNRGLVRAADANDDIVCKAENKRAIHRFDMPRLFRFGRLFVDDLPI